MGGEILGLPPEVFAEARRVAQRDALVTVRHVVPLESPLQEAVEAGDGAPPRPPEQQPTKLLLFLVHSRLPRVAAITAVQCDAALLSPEHHQFLLAAAATTSLSGRCEDAEV